ncbi:MAG: Ig-like domain-containing protein, partial [Nitrospirae bacterium]|nr:Ig-like domain-containing protein [Nitrospirota bacterium]
SFADTTPPTFGGIASATASSTTEINLSWNAAADNITSSSNIVYLIYMSTTSGGQNLAVPSFTTSAGATSYTVTGLSPTTTYYFIVRAKDEAGNIDTNTVEISATTLTPSDTTPPTFGGLVSATTLSSSEISLSWNAAADNVTSSANIAYLIYMSATSGGQNFSTPTSVVKGATSKTISGLTPSTTYYFVVRAMDEAGNIDSNTIEKSATTKSSDTTPPTVIIINPANGATNVSVDNVVSATFSEVMDSTTVNSSTFILKDSNNNPVDGTVAYSGVTASFIATSSLSYSTTYTATITTGVKDLAGNAMTSPYSWSFTTGSAPDTTAPTVISTSPADGATNISVTTTITVTFSETMDSSTINTTTFTLTDSSGNLIGGTVTYSGTTATFTPSTSLSYSTTYTATITTGVKDLAGNAMTSDYVWTFTTEASTLVEAHSKYWSDGYYVQFSYYDPGYTATSVSVTGYGITGSLTLTYNTTKGRWDSYTSPSNNLYLGTTYPTPPVTYTFTITDSTGTWTATDAVDCFMTEFATTLSPLGTVTTATPTFSWTAVSQTNMEYQVQLNDSSGSRIWDSQIGVDISSTTYNGPALTSGATYYYYVVVRPVGGDCESFAQGSFVYSAPDTTAPTVISTSPVNGGFDIPRTTTITATFSETVDCSTVNDTTFLLSWGGGSVAGTITCSGDTATFTPSTGLSYNTTYTASITTGVKDLAGNAMTSNYSWTFTSVEF